MLQKRLYRLAGTNFPTPQELTWRPDDVVGFGRAKCSLHKERGSEAEHSADERHARKVEGKDITKRGGKQCREETCKACV